MKLDPQVFTFLEQIKQTPTLAWFNAHKSEFQLARDNALELYQAIEREIAPLYDFKPLHVYGFRSLKKGPNAIPFKLHFGCNFAFHPPKKHGSLYLQLQPGGTYLAGGIWSPKPRELFLVRKSIEQESTLVTLLGDPAISTYFDTQIGYQVKKVPYPFDETHPRADWLRYRQFILQKKYTDKQVLSAQFVAQIKSDFQRMLPFVSYLSEVLNYDENGTPLYE